MDSLRVINLRNRNWQYGLWKWPGLIMSRSKSLFPTLFLPKEEGRNEEASEHWFVHTEFRMIGFGDRRGWRSHHRLCVLFVNGSFNMGPENVATSLRCLQACNTWGRSWILWRRIRDNVFQKSLLAMQVENAHLLHSWVLYKIYDLYPEIL